MRIDFYYRAQRERAKDALREGRTLARCELLDRVAYNYMDGDGRLHCFWLYQTDALNTRLQEQCIRK